MLDGYCREKLARLPVLSGELVAGKTGLAAAWGLFWGRKPDRARELLGLAAGKRNPGAWLNVVLSNETKDIRAAADR